MHNKKVYLRSLGCDKNAVDAEYILGDLVQAGFKVTGNPDEADLIIVNTCCFIEEAKTESIEAIFDLLEEKKPDGKLIVSGCMAERYKKELTEEIPEIDAFLGLKETDRILNLIDTPSAVSPSRFLESEGYAYLKIAEGCNKNCTYCAIPGIRGAYKSRKPEEIYTEARELERAGVKELILIAQDLTQYGSDLEEPTTLVNILEHLATDFSFSWIRMLYLYPEGITSELLETVKKNKNILPYFDIPIQHTNDRILRKMGRHITKAKIKELVSTIRHELPDSVLRSTVIVGFPSETEEEFKELLEDLKELRFDRMGAFAYSREEGTPAYFFTPQIETEIKEDRKNQLVKQQYDTMYKQNLRLVSKTLPAMVIGETEDQNVYEARLVTDAPEIDCIAYINSPRTLQPDEIVPVRISSVIGYDLIGEIDESTE